MLECSGAGSAVNADVLLLQRRCDGEREDRLIINIYHHQYSLFQTSSPCSVSAGSTALARTAVFVHV